MATNSFWESFGDSSAYQEVSDGFTGSLAAQVVESYGLECSTDDIGGSLSSLDIKQMDALQLIKISLLQDSIDNSHGPYEAYVDYSDGRVEFREVGAYSASVSDIYFETQTSRFVERCSGALVYGGKPLIQRLEKPWVSVFTDGKQIYDTTNMTSNCQKDGFSASAKIVYKDPNLNTNYNDGIDNLYDVTDPYESVVGYGRMINTPGIRDNTTITHSRQTSVPVLVPDAITTLVRRPYVPAGDVDLGSDCWSVYSEGVEGGTEIPVNGDFRYSTAYGTTQDNFIGISKVYAVGIELAECGSKPKTYEAMKKAKTGTDSENDHEVWVSIDDTQKKTIVLREGEDYVINYEDGSNPRIQFANNAMRYDKAKYGKDTMYNVRRNCEYTRGKDELLNQIGIILPTKNMGILVSEIWVMVDIATPSIFINDPNGNARQIAENLEYELMPIVIYEEPQPIGFNGRLIDQRDGITDKDPTTRQASFNATQLEQAMQQLNGGGGITLNLSFLDGPAVASLSGLLYRYMNSGDGIETVYTCGPDCNPKLGGYHSSGGVINKITHSYTDSGSYTVSVYESNRLIEDTDLVGISGGPYFKRSESPSVRGTVIADLGNHIHYRVRVDGFGEQLAINCQSEVLRVGDKITCTIHNNPVEQ